MWNDRVKKILAKKEKKKYPKDYAQALSTEKEENGANERVKEAHPVWKKSNVRCHLCGKIGHMKKDCPDSKKKEKRAYASEKEDWKKNVICYNCGKKGHFGKECPEPDKRKQSHFVATPIMNSMMGTVLR